MSQKSTAARWRVPGVEAKLASEADVDPGRSFPALARIVREQLNELSDTPITSEVVMWTILTGEFFWGIVIGLLLSFLGGYVLARLTVHMTNVQQETIIRNFCADTVRNIGNIVTEMDKTRDRTKAIYHDYLAIIDVEVQVFGRNREHLPRIADEKRIKVRNFVNDVAIKLADMQNYLKQYYQLTDLARQIQTEGRGPEAQRVHDEAIGLLNEAHKATDRLVTLAKDAPALAVDLAKK